jgi:hypothetical protein
MTGFRSEAIVKESAAVAPGPDDDASPTGTFLVVLSTPTRDRDGEEVKSDEWETPLPEHITFDVDHGMSVASTVGSGVPTIDDDGRLIVAGRYASTPLGQQTRALVKEGHIRTTSVAFLRKSDGGKDARPLRELLNGAFVAVPANREALVLDSKATTKVGARHSAADMEKLQAAHDLMKSMGAQCDAPAKTITLSEPAEPVDTKAPDASPDALGTSDPDESTTTDTADTTESDAKNSAAAKAAADVAAADHVAAMWNVHVAALRNINELS